MKLRRSERLISMTNYLLMHPSELISLSFFSEKYDAAKSSISEDLSMIKQTFEKSGLGTLMTYPGATGGVKYSVSIQKDIAVQWLQDLQQTIEKQDRVLPGGFLYLNDILGDTCLLQKIGKLIATKYANQSIDAVMTIVTKGIPIAYAVASQLNVPVIIVRRDSFVTEGPTVSINYISGSSKRIQTMVLSKRSLASKSNILIVDDFMKAGGTINGMINLLKEFNAEVKGIAVLIEANHEKEKLVDDYLSLIRISEVDEQTGKIHTSIGNYLS